MSRAYTVRKTCRSCGSEKLTPFWSAGDVFVVRFPKQPVDMEGCPTAPLTLCLCEECWLVQLQDTVAPELLYTEFFYRSGMNEMMRAELADIAHSAYNTLYYADRGYDHADAGSITRVLDIGCNDGTLLQSYPAGRRVTHAMYAPNDFERVGIDPASNIQLPGRQEGGWHFIQDYFSAKRVLEFSNGGRYDIITAIAMFYDLEDPFNFVKEIGEALQPNGVCVVQMNYLPSMLYVNGIDNVCHEHLTYFSLSTLTPLFNRAGMTIFKAELNRINGGSLRIHACHAGAYKVGSSVENILNTERELKLNTIEPYAKFAQRVHVNCHSLDEFLQTLVESNRRVYAYGASTRGTTLLQLLPTAMGTLRGVAERDTNKFGRVMVGTWTQIISEEEAREQAEYFLVLPWHFWPAIKGREKAWLEKGGKFIIPLPIPHVFSIEDDGEGNKEEVMQIIHNTGVVA